jgi:hypothetical protein
MSSWSRGQGYYHPPKRKVFVSYHHELDQGRYDEFNRLFCASLDLVTNRSLQEPVDSDKLDYVHRAIREQNIKGTSLTIVLCGAETWKRKCVDWEIGSTLNMDHALLGVGLPTASRSSRGAIIVPDRLHVNCQGGYARWLSCPFDGNQLLAAIEDAITRSRTYSCDNSLPFMTRNRP